jgi:hypothetical protein
MFGKAEQSLLQETVLREPARPERRTCGELQALRKKAL